MVFINTNQLFPKPGKAWRTIWGNSTRRNTCQGVMPASKGGKLKTLLQTAGIGFLAMPLFDVLGFWWAYVGWFFLGAALVVTVVTGVDYVRQAIALRRTALASGRTAG